MEGSGAVFFAEGAEGQLQCLGGHLFGGVPHHLSEAGSCLEL
jgi:hypothetical protein